MVKVYKVVLARLRDKKDKENQQILSAFTPEDFAVEYLPGQRAYPRLEGSYLYAWEDLQAAKQYVGTAKDTVLSNDAVLRVYEASADVVAAPEVYHTELPFLDQFWQQQWWLYSEGYPYVLTSEPGTVWCHTIRLEDVVWTDGRSLKTERATQSNPQRNPVLASPSMRYRR
jgi:hypothetical protein